MKFFIQYFCFYHLIVILLSGTCLGAQNNFTKCDILPKFSILPNHFPAKDLYLGTDGNEEELEYILPILKKLQKSQPHLKTYLVLPKGINEILKESSFKNISLKNLISIDSGSTLWLQDSFEFIVDSGENNFDIKTMDLPYIDESKEVANQIATFLGIKNIRIRDKRIDSFLGGNHGGNIEPLPGNLVLIGDSISDEMKTALGKYFPIKNLIVAKTSLLEVGHVDELFMILPDFKNKHCPFALAYASPDLAFDLLRKQLKKDPSKPMQITSSDSMNFKESVQSNRISRCIADLNSKKVNLYSQECLDFLKINRFWSDSISKDKEEIYNGVVANTKCKSFRTVKFPVIFKADSFEFGSPSLTTTVYSNPINLITVNKDLFVAKQKIESFNKNITLTARQLGLQLHLVNADFLHNLQGGLHCISKIKRECKR